VFGISFRWATATLLVLGGTAFADQLYFVSAGSVTWNGVYVTPYLAYDPTLNPNDLTVYCDDWNTEFFGDPTWNANVYALTAANLSNFKFGKLTADYRMTLNPGDTLSFASSSANVLDLYLEAAWLDNQLRTTSPTVIQQEELAAAMWTLFVDGADVGGLVAGINNSGYGLAVYDDLEAAQNAVNDGYNAAGWDVIVPTDNAFPMQEFLVYNNVPEPSALLLLGTAAGFLTLTKIRRKRRA
jgi:hypothetical protein